MSDSTSKPESPDPALRSWLQVVRESLRGEQHDYTRGRLGHAILLLAVPMVLEMAMESVFAVCDVFWVSRLDSDAAVAAVGITESMLTIFYALGVGFSMAATALIARRIGEKNPAGAVRAGTQALIIGVVFGVISGVPCVLFAKELLALMDATPDVIEVGHGYTAILLGTNIVILLLFLQNAIFRGAGDAVLAMRSLWLANGINLVLDPLLIFGIGPFPEMGVTGAAVATTIGRGTGVLYQFWMLRRGQSRIALRGPAFRIHLNVMLELLRLSFGGVTQFLIATASWVALMRIVTRFGDSAVAGYTFAIRILIFALLPSWGLANSATTLVGQNLGARQPDRAERSVWLTGWFNMLFLGLVTIVFVSFARPLISVFTDNPETVRHGTDALCIMSYGYVFYAWGMVAVHAFNGAGDTMTPTWINFFCFWCFQIPLAWTLAVRLGFGPRGVFWSVAIAESLIAIIAVAIFRRGRWKETKLAEDAVAETNEA